MNEMITFVRSSVLMESSKPQTTDVAARNSERQAEDRGMVIGVGLALAELIRTFGQPTMASSIARNFAYDLATYRRAGLEEYDLKELRKAIR
jgi:hypothetical protein